MSNNNIQSSKFVDEIIENKIIGWFDLESRETEDYTFQHNGFIWSIHKLFNEFVEIQISYSNLNQFSSNTMTNKEFYRQFVRKQCWVYLQGTKIVKKQNSINRNGFDFETFDIKMPPNH